MKKALITGIAGQDGYFLAQLLLGKGYEVHGLARRNSQQSLGSIDFLPKETKSKIIIQWGDVTDTFFIEEIAKKHQYDEIYHLAAQSFVGLSFTNPKLTYDINIGGTLNIANAVKEFSPKSKVYFAATSEMFGKVMASPQNETTPFYPRSPYGVSKLAGFWTMKNYREAYHLKFSSGILFNHESEMRGKEFVTRKVSTGVAEIKQGVRGIIELGNLDAMRDWGYAPEYTEAMWLMLQKDEPDDFVIATGEHHSIREFVEAAFGVIGIEIGWEGSGENEVGKNRKTGETVVKVDPQFYRPSEVDELIGDASKAKNVLGWLPKITFKDLVRIMVEHDIATTEKRS